MLNFNNIDKVTVKHCFHHEFLVHSDDMLSIEKRCVYRENVVFEHFSKKEYESITKNVGCMSKWMSVSESNIYQKTTYHLGEDLEDMLKYMEDANEKYVTQKIKKVIRNKKLKELLDE